jgi:GGDEF domain-containing protein
VNSTSIAKAEGAENHGCLALIDLAAFDAVNDGKSGQHAHASGLAQ